MSQYENIFSIMVYGYSEYDCRQNKFSRFMCKGTREEPSDTILNFYRCMDNDLNSQRALLEETFLK